MARPSVVLGRRPGAGCPQWCGQSRVATTASPRTRLRSVDVHRMWTGLGRTKQYLAALDGLHGLEAQVTAHSTDWRGLPGRESRVLNPLVRTYVRVRIPSRG